MGHELLLQKEFATPSMGAAVLNEDIIISFHFNCNKYCSNFQKVGSSEHRAPI